MSISMNNHETRIKALENISNTSNITHGLGWINIGNSIEIRYGASGSFNPNSNYEKVRTVTMAKPFTKTIRSAIISTTNNSPGCDFGIFMSNINQTTISIIANQLGSGSSNPSLYRCEYIAIGYLITNRLLNHIREVIL